jgi:adenylate kinase family enzyme
VIIGCGGSGKSYVARTLGKLLDAPVTHLDTVFYDSEWNELPMLEFEERQRVLVAEPIWVIDGNYNSTLPVRLHACDTVVFLDLPAATCLWAAARRQLRNGAGQHKAVGEYNRLHRGVIRYIRTYRKTMRPKGSPQDRGARPACRGRHVDQSTPGAPLASRRSSRPGTGLTIQQRAAFPLRLRSPWARPAASRSMPTAVSARVL